VVPVGAHERVYSEAIRDCFIRTERASHLESAGINGDELERRLTVQHKRARLTQRDHATAGSFEGHGGADIVLVSRQDDQTLMAIEVKIGAKGAVGIESVEKALEYKGGLALEFPDWKIKAMVVAVTTTPVVEELADREGVELWRYDPEEDRLHRDANSTTPERSK
jgi:hypothetical protein